MTKLIENVCATAQQLLENAWLASQHKKKPKPRGGGFVSRAEPSKTRASDACRTTNAGRNHIIKFSNFNCLEIEPVDERTKNYHLRLAWHACKPLQLCAGLFATH